MVDHDEEAEPLEMSVDFVGKQASLCCVAVVPTPKIENGNALGGGIACWGCRSSERVGHGAPLVRP